MFGDIGKMMKQAQELQARMGAVQEEIQRLEVGGSAGGDLVSVTLGGRGELKGVKIDPSLLSGGEAGIVEDLIIAAHAEAKAHLDRAIAERMGAVTGGLELPPGLKLPF